MTRDLVLGLEVVLADGRIWNGLKVLRKDNRGYDLKQIFIGSEGTLGIVTAAALKLFPKPTQIETALVGLRSVEDAMALYARARRDCSDLLTAFELILRGGIEITMRAAPYGSVAWLRSDLEFHRTVAEATRNSYMGQFLVFVSERVRESILAAGNQQKSDDMARITLGEHERILSAIRAGDAEGAQAAMCNLYNITTSQEAIRQWTRTLRDILGNLEPSIDIYPNQPGPVVRHGL